MDLLNRLPKSLRDRPETLMRVGPRLAAILFGLAVVLMFWNFASSGDDRERIAVQNRVVMSLERLLSAARDVETGSRGYVLLGSDPYLEPYRSALAGTTVAENAVRTAWHDSGGAAAEIETLFGLVARKQHDSIQLVELRRTAGFADAQAFAASGEGKAVMDSIRVEVAKLQAGATAARRRIERTERRRSFLLTIASSALAALAVALLGWLAWIRRRAEQATSLELVGLGDRFRTLADNIPQLAWMADNKGDLYWFNQRWYDYTGTTPAEMMNGGWSTVHDPEYLKAASARFLDSMKAGTAWQDTFPLRGKDGEYRWFLSRAEPVRNQKGEIIRWFGTNTDVTEQREQEAELEAARDAAEDANRAKSQFLANMSHELRTPLSAVIGYSEMLEEEVEELGEQHLLDDLAKIKSNARHLLSLINDVLDISKIEANKMEVFAETFDVAGMVRDVASTVGSLVDKKRNRLVLGPMDEVGTMHSDVVKIRQVLINLLSNASKFTEDGEIHLDARREPGRPCDVIVFTVRDTGLGMTDEQVTRLFQRFSQADASTTRRFGGTGLGLAITKAFSNMLGGSVSVESRTGEGSVFTIALPVELAVDAPLDQGGGEPAHGPTDEDDVVLVIDDDAATRDLLTRFLTREGYTVRSAADGRAGLDLAGVLKPKVIILDVTMPRMDGWSVLRSLKDDPHLAAIPVVMCTVIDEQTLGFSLGASDYLLKPVNWDRLKEVLDRLQADMPQGDVLVVDDDSDTRTRLEGLLSKNGWTVTEAENGRDALEAVKARVPSLVLLDLNMPEMDGFTFLREFRSSPDWVSIPVIVMTARDLTADERAELKGGGARVFSKGQVSMQDLVGQLRAVVPPRSGGARAERADPVAAG